MFRLRSKQLQVGYIVVAWIFVNMMYDFFLVEVTPQMLLHDISMFENIFQARLFGVGRKRMVIGGDNHDITINPDFFATLPPWSKMLFLAIHWVVLALHSLAIHRVIFSRYISMIRGVFICKVYKSTGATFRTKLARSARIRINFFPALNTIYDFTGTVSFIWHTPILACGRRNDNT